MRRKGGLGMRVWSGVNWRWRRGGTNEGRETGSGAQREVLGVLMFGGAGGKVDLWGSAR